MAAGDEYYHALSSFGSDIGKGIQQNILRNKATQQKVLFDQTLLDNYARTPDPTDPSGNKMLIDPKKVLQLRQLNKEKFLAAAEAEMQWADHAQKLQKAAAPIREIMLGGQPAFIGPGGGIHFAPDQTAKKEAAAKKRQDAARQSLSDAFGVPSQKLPDAISKMQGYVEGKTPFPKFGRFEGTTKDIPGEDKDRMIAAFNDYNAQLASTQEQQQPKQDQSVQQDSIAQANQIKANFRAGKLSREDAIQQIRALGIPGLTQ